MGAHRGRIGVGLLIAAVIALTGVGVVIAQDGPVAAMFREDLKREASLGASFLPIEVPVREGSPLHVYLSAGDLARAFDRPAFRPDAAMMPTNTGLVVTAATPATQRVLIGRVQRAPGAMASLQEQLVARRAQASSEGAVLQLSVDAFVAKLQTPAAASAAFPKMVCFIATDYPTGGGVDRRDLFSQDRVRKGVAACLSELDAAGATSVVMPLLGAASAKTQSRDREFEGQRLLKECRHLNAAAGLALGIRDFAGTRRTLREIGIVQWDRELHEMFDGGRLGQTAYAIYADQIKQAVTKGIAGEKTTSVDVGGSCAATFGA